MKKTTLIVSLIGILLIGCSPADVHDNNTTIYNVNNIEDNTTEENNTTVETQNEISSLEPDTLIEPIAESDTTIVQEVETNTTTEDKNTTEPEIVYDYNLTEYFNVDINFTKTFDIITKNSNDEITSTYTNVGVLNEYTDRNSTSTIPIPSELFDVANTDKTGIDKNDHFFTLDNNYTCVASGETEAMNLVGTTYRFMLIVDCRLEQRWYLYYYRNQGLKLIKNDTTQEWYIGNIQ